MTKDLGNKITSYVKAIDLIAEREGFVEFEKDHITYRITEDIISGQLKLINPESGKSITISELIINGFVQIDDLNKWLESNEYNFKFDPSLVSEKIARDSSNAPTVPGVAKLRIAAAFQDLHYSYEQWRKYLATPPDWLKPCRVSKGSRGKSGGALWDPIAIGLCLLDKDIPINTLDFKIHSYLISFKPAWEEKTSLFRN